MAVADRTPGLLQAVPGASLPLRQTPRWSAPVCQHLWLCLGFPQLALEVLDQSDVSQPVVVVDGQETRRVVYSVSRPARLQGIYPGLGLNAAYALCPSLQALERDPRLEAGRLRQLARWAGRYTPWVSVVPPAALLLEVRGSLSLFGGAQSLCANIETGLDVLNHRRRLAMAPTPLAALWLARAGKRSLISDPGALPGQLGHLSLRNLHWPDKLIASLTGMGVRRIGDCLRLPRDGFARRFGKKYLEELDRALGRRADPRDSFVAPERFRLRLELPAETDDAAQLTQAAAQLITQLSAFLMKRQAAVQSLLFRFCHLDAPVTLLRVGMLERCRDAQHLLSLFTARLEQLTLPAAVAALELTSGRLSTVVAAERDLFNAADAAGWPALLDSLRNRLGATAVFGVASVAEHRPEAAWRRVTPRLEDSALDAQADTGRYRPVWLLSTPQVLNQVDGRPYCDGLLVRESGPECIESGWWDGSDVVRDYYVARNPCGLRLWIYRERRAPREWCLHGYFG